MGGGDITLDTELARSRGPSGKLEMLRGLCCRTDTAGHLGILEEAEALGPADTDTGGFDDFEISSADFGEISGLGEGS